MATPFANAARSGEVFRFAPMAQPIESMTLLLTSWTTSSGRSVYFNLPAYSASMWAMVIGNCKIPSLSFCQDFLHQHIFSAAGMDCVLGLWSLYICFP